MSKSIFKERQSQATDVYFVVDKDDDLNDTRPPTGSRWILLTFTLGIIALVIWAAIGKIDQVTRAPAVVIPGERTQLIQSPDGGVLTAVQVREGQIVKAGQVLATLQRERAQAAVADSQAKVAALRITLARLKAEVYGHPQPLFGPDLLSYTEYIRNQTDLFNKRQTAFKEDMAALDGIIALARDELEINRKLLAKGDVSRAEVIRLERGLADVNAQQASRRNKYFQDAQAEMTKAQEDLNSQLEQLKDRRQLLDHTELIAPMDAVVNSIKVTTVGGVVRPGETVIELLPRDDELVVEAKVPPSDIAFVQVGQSVSVKLDAYDATVFGGVRGEVIYISADALFAEKASPGVPVGPMNPPIYYVVRIKLLKKEFLGERANDIEIRPGLTAQVEIKALERTVLSYLTKPITKTLSQSLGER